VSSRSSKRQQLIESLKDKESRDFYVESFIRNGLAFQIRAIREARGWTQGELGERAGGVKQETVSQLEDPNYGNFTLRTLRRLAAAFDVALSVRFEPFSRLVDYISDLSPESLAVPGFEADEGLATASRSPRPAMVTVAADQINFIGDEPYGKLFVERWSVDTLYLERRSTADGVIGADSSTGMVVHSGASTARSSIQAHVAWKDDRPSQPPAGPAPYRGSMAA
jgi:transcriptional regulator with XRE-family HTH domain